MKAIEQRLAKLEHAVTAGATVYTWAEAGETPEQAIARQFSSGLAENASVIVYRWSE
jgi:hypothetical protein